MLLLIVPFMPPVIYAPNTAEIKDVIHIAKTIHGECSICGNKEQQLVGSVIMNRVRSKKFPNSIADVLNQKRQFQAPKNYFTENELRNAYIAYKSPVKGVLYFHNPRTATDIGHYNGRARYKFIHVFF